MKPAPKRARHVSPPHIRIQDRFCASPKRGERSSWTEYQVMRGNKVISRHDLPSQANAALAQLRRDLGLDASDAESRQAEHERQTGEC